MVARLLLLTALLSLQACNNSHGEGFLPGQCADSIDNDGDNVLDCEDPDCAGSPDCAPVPPLDACAEGSEQESCLVVASVQVEPSQVQPGEPYTISIWIAHSEAVDVVLEVAGQPIGGAELLQPSEGGLRGDITATAQLPLGDQLIALRARHSSGDIAGFTLLHVSNQDLCPDGQVREAGSCVTPHAGIALSPTGLFYTPYAGDITGLPAGGSGERMMLHPRRVFPIEQSLVACLTDSVAVIDPEQMFPIDAAAFPGGPKPPAIMERAEGLLDPDGLALCDDLAVDPARRLAVTMTRGALGQPAGLTSWSLPDLSEPPFADPVMLETFVDAGGFESGLFADGHLYVTGKPNRLSVFTVDEQGAFTLVSEQDLPGCTSAWAITREGAHLFVTDAGVHPERAEGEPRGGTLFVLDATDPAAPDLLGSIPTLGIGKALAASSDGRVALAGGEAGLEIFDVSDGSEPTLSEHINTPGSAISVAWSGGYLLLSDWNSMRLYDVVEPGATRLLSATDFALTQLDRPEPNPEWAMDNSGFVALSGADFIITEMDSIFVGQLQPGATSPSLNLIDRRWSLAATPEDQDANVVLRMSNGGRSALEVQIRQQEGLSPSGQRYLLAPGEREAIELEAIELLDHPDRRFVRLDSNDPMQDERRATLVVLEGGLAVGDSVPPFRLPITNSCAEGLCSQEVNCFHLDDSQWEGMPILLAFYTSW